MVIKTNIGVKRPNITSKRPGSLIYEIGKAGLQYYRYYEDIKQYDPGYYIEKYKYKPAKRVTSYATQKIQKTYDAYYKQHQKRSRSNGFFGYKQCEFFTGKSSEQSCLHSRY